MSVKLSVIVPVYNVEDYLDECLDSLVNQKYKDMEIICVNDGSTDGSADILEKYNKKYASVKVVNKENGGLSSARNTGVENANGKYVVFMDSDDLWADDDVAAYIVGDMEKENLDMLVFGIEPFYENSELEIKFGSSKEYYRYKKGYGYFEHGYEMLQTLLQADDYLSSACIKAIKKEVMEKENLSFFNGIVHEDELFSFLLFMSVNRCRHTNKIIYLRRYRSGSIMSRKKSFRNLYGYFIAWRESLVWLQKNDIPKMAENVAENMLSSFGKAVVGTYKNIEDAERRKLKSCGPADRYMILDLLLRTPSISNCVNHFAFPYHLVTIGSRVVLYGAGDVGQHMWRQINNEKIVVPVAMVDKNADKIKLPYVYPVDVILKLNYDYIIITIKDEDIALEVKKTLKLYGIKDDSIKWDGKNYDLNKYNVNVVGPILKRLQENEKN